MIDVAMFVFNYSLFSIFIHKYYGSFNINTLVVCSQSIRMILIPNKYNFYPRLYYSMIFHIMMINKYTRVVGRLRFTISIKLRFQHGDAVN